MTEHDGSMTDRWMGVFRSVERGPISDKQYGLVRALRRRSVTQALIGLALVVAPILLTAIAVGLSLAMLAVAILFGFFSAMLGAGFTHMGFTRYRHMNAIRKESDIEVFVGTTPTLPVGIERVGALDSTTARVVLADVISSGRTHRLVVHPETGLLIEVDGVLVEDFVGGDVSITARRPNEPAVDPAATARPLGTLEKHEAKLLCRRLTRGTWGPALGIASALAALVSFVWSITGGSHPAARILGLVLPLCASLMFVVAGDWWHRRRLRAKIERDIEAGLQRTDDRWLLPESGICWETDGLPGPLRLAGGGLGNEADGQIRPVMF